MTDDEIAEAKAVVLRSPTRPRYRDDAEIIIRANDLAVSEREPVRRLADELGAVVRRATVCEVRESEVLPLIGDVEFEFRVNTLG